MVIDDGREEGVRVRTFVWPAALPPPDDLVQIPLKVLALEAVMHTD